MPEVIVSARHIYGGRSTYYRRYHRGGRCEYTGFLGLIPFGPVHWTGPNGLDGLVFWTDYGPFRSRRPTVEPSGTLRIGPQHIRRIC